MQVGRANKAVMVRRAVLGEVVTEVSSDGFPINEKLAFPGAVLHPIEAHVNGFAYCFFIVPLENHSAVELSTWIRVGGCNCPSSVRLVCIGAAS